MRLVTVCGLLVWGLLPAACSPEIPAITGTLSEEPFHSQLVEDDYLLRIRLPPSYDADPTRRYPLIVQLDPTFVGLHQFEITAGLVSAYAQDGR